MDRERPNGASSDPELDKALSQLLELARNEAVSPRLRELAEQLEEALRKKRRDL